MLRLVLFNTAKSNFVYPPPITRGLRTSAVLPTSIRTPLHRNSRAYKIQPSPSTCQARRLLPTWLFVVAISSIHAEHPWLQGWANYHICQSTFSLSTSAPLGVACRRTFLNEFKHRYRLPSPSTTWLTLKTSRPPAFRKHHSEWLDAKCLRHTVLRGFALGLFLYHLAVNP